MKKSINHIVQFYIYCIKEKITPRFIWVNDANTPETELSPRKAFTVSCHYSLCVNLISHLNKRKEPCTKIVESFSCEINIKHQSPTDEAKALQECYSDDLSENFSNELLQFATFTADKN